MEIHKEMVHPHSVRAYSDTHLMIGDSRYEESVIVHSGQIICPWPVSTMEELTEEACTPMLQLNPEVILIGLTNGFKPLPLNLIATLSKLRIGIECMSIGAACRTFNILLQEERRVVLGVLY